MQNLDFTYDNASGLLQAFSLLARKTAEQEKKGENDFEQ